MDHIARQITTLAFIAGVAIAAPTDLQVIPPDTTDSITVPAAIETCGLQVYPVNSQP